MPLSANHSGKSEQNHFPLIDPFLCNIHTDSWHTNTSNNPSQSLLICVHVCVLKSSRTTHRLAHFSHNLHSFGVSEKQSCSAVILYSSSVHLAAFQQPGRYRGLSPRRNKTFTTNECEVFAIN